MKDSAQAHKGTTVPGNFAFKNLPTMVDSVGLEDTQEANTAKRHTPAYSGDKTGSDLQNLRSQSKSCHCVGALLYTT